MSGIQDLYEKFLKELSGNGINFDNDVWNTLSKTHQKNKTREFAKSILEKSNRKKFRKFLESEKCKWDDLGSDTSGKV